MVLEFKGGRKPPTRDKPRLKFSQFKKAYTPPTTADYLSEVGSWPMFLNDRIGDCTIAAAAHMLEAWTQYGRAQATLLNNVQVEQAYSAVSGYDPKTGANDNGAVMQEVLSYWRKTGIGGTKILAFAEVDITNKEECYQATASFEALYLGINFPKFAMDQFNAGDTWHVSDQNTQIEGGHAINAGWYDSSIGMWRVITWGRVQEMTQEFFDKYVDEAWVVITDDLFDPTTGKNPEGIDKHALGESFAAMTGEANPFPAPEPTPSPVVGNDATQTLATALRRFLKTTHEPRYLHDAATNWLNQL